MKIKNNYVYFNMVIIIIELIWINKNNNKNIIIIFIIYFNLIYKLKCYNSL